VNLITEEFRGRMRKLFPDRQIYIRTGGSSRYFCLPGTAQAVGAMGLAVLLAGTALTVTLSGRISANDPQMAVTITGPTEAGVAAQQELLQAAESRNQALTGTLAEMEREVNSARARAEEERRIAAVLEQQIIALQAEQPVENGQVIPDIGARLAELRASREAAQIRLAEELRSKEDRERRQSIRIASLQADIAELSRERDLLASQLDKSDQGRSKAEIRAEALSARLGDLQTSIASQKSRTHSLEKELSVIVAQLDTAQLLRQANINPGNLVAPPGQKIQTAESPPELERRISELLEIEDGLIGQLEKSAAHDLAFVERVVRKTGLDIEALMDSLDPESTAIGGPFLDLSEMRKVTKKMPKQAEVSNRISNLNYQLSRLSWLEIALKSIPLAAPVEDVRTTSGFGRRSDPFTRKSAFHSGLDFAGARGTEIRATAPGVVIFAGRKSSYGWFVEIDHGHGLRTRYAHMKSVSVKPGEVVKYSQAVGKMGSTGRSTGTHLHYEVTFNGKFFDPKQFIEAGRDVFKIQNELAEKSLKVSAGR